MCISDWSSGLCSSDLPITRIICTHFHPDHLGLAGWLQERWNAPLWMTHGEWTFGRMLELEAAPKVPPEVIAFYQAIGFDAGQIETLKTRGFGNFRKAVSPIPRAFRSEEHTSELQSLMRISYAVFCL